MPVSANYERSEYRPLALGSSLALPWSAYCSALNRFVYPHPSAGFVMRTGILRFCLLELFGRKPISDSKVYTLARGV